VGEGLKTIQQSQVLLRWGPAVLGGPPKGAGVCARRSKEDTMAGWNDIDRTLDMMDELRRRMDWLFPEQDRGRAQRGLRSLYGDNDRSTARSPAAWPPVNVFDTGSTLVIEADVPGLVEKDVGLMVHDDVLTLRGERKADLPSGYTPHRRERGPVQFSRSFALPCKVDFEKTTAVLKDGVLTVTLSKAPEAQPRQIQVQVK
jgi:HSP20 family protein